MQELSILIYSKDRAFQLDGCIRSLIKYSSIQLNSVSVLYKTTENFGAQYDVLIKKFPAVHFIKEQSGKLLNQTIDIIKNSEYIMFVVDDTVFYRYFHIKILVKKLAQYPLVLGVSLRLGLNTSFCYMANRKQRVPEYKFVNDDILIYDWSKEECDFGYPLEVSSSIYRSEDILSILLKYSGQKLCPSLIESRLNISKDMFVSTKPKLMMPMQSYAFSIPINLTKNGSNPHGRFHHYSIEFLGRLFDDNKTMDLGDMDTSKIIGVHQEMEINVI